MNEIVKGGNEKNISETDSKQNILSLQKDKRYIITTDEDGNIEDCFQLNKKNLGKGWGAMYQAALSNIADMKEMTLEQYRVLFKLFSKMDFNNYLCVSQQKLADELQMQRPNVARAMKALKEKNIIVEGPKIGNSKTYLFNPYVTHKGKNRKETILDFENELAKQGKNIIDASKDFE